MDASDTLAPLRQLFHMPKNQIYLDGNSLGVLPRDTAQRLQAVVTQEWGQDLIQSWNSAGWIDLPQRLGDKIARLVGAAPGTLCVADSTSVNLFKVLSAATRVSAADSSGTAARRIILSDSSNFPTDLYIAQSLATEHGLELKAVEAGQITQSLNADVAVLMLTAVNYRTGELLDMAEITAAAHRAGALTVWDLAHSAGAHEVDLTGCNADFAVGCGYKYLNGGPGAPAFVWAHPRHASRFWQPLAGWMGHAAPFAFTPDYVPAPGIARFLCGTPSILAMAALECGIDTVLAATPMGGMAAIRAKSLALTRLFIQCVDELCIDQDLTVVTPRDDHRRGSQVSLSHPGDGYAIVQALIARGVVGDFRAPDILRFGFTPLYTRFVDVFDSAQALAEVLKSGEWQQTQFHKRAAVT
jgi:kynureninase